MRLLHNKSRAAALYLICIRSCHSAESPRTPVKSYRCARDRAVERNFSNVQPRRAQRPFVRHETFAGGMKKSLPGAAGRLQTLLQLRARLLRARNWNDAATTALNGTNLPTATAPRPSDTFLPAVAHASSGVNSGS